MASTFALRVVTPIGLKCEEQVSSVTLPGSDGEIGVLPGHASYIGLLGTGVLTYVLATGGEGRSMAVSGGFIQFSNETLTVVADTAELPEDVNAAAVAYRKQEIADRLSAVSGYESEWENLRRELDRLEADEKVAGRHS